LDSIPAPIAGCPTSRSFFARCGIPQASPSSLLRVSQLRRGAPRSPQRTWAEKDGRPQISYFALLAVATGPSTPRVSTGNLGGSPTTALSSRPNLKCGANAFGTPGPIDRCPSFAFFAGGWDSQNLIPSAAERPSVPRRFLLVRFRFSLIGYWRWPSRRMRCLRLLSRPCGPATAKIFHLLRTQGASWINGLNSPSLLSERRLHRCGWGLVNERPRLIGRARSRSLDLRRHGLHADRLRLRGIATRRFRLLHRPCRYRLRGCRRPCRGSFWGWTIGCDRRRHRVRHSRWSDDLRLALLREPGAVNRLCRRCGLAGTIHRGSRHGRANGRSRGSGALKTLSRFHHRAGLDRRNGPGCGLCCHDRRCRSD
jgi:hypothetical protein